MDIDVIERLIRIVDESTVTEIEIKEEGKSIRISRATQDVDSSPPVTAPQGGPRKVPKREHTPENLFRSPMVGSFYRASSEEEAPFVEEGQQVKKGAPLCIIEAMKMLNMVEADREGVIEEILVHSGQAVEFGQPLFVIKE
ncbi:MAG: acetyl-CoA carboxylase biotin carboxyl carrier protein [Proteobacteria bacterium]|nr:acetyl-CoA carboxylase biotin carboxyl carrier protein [Pseudomonadota bacterium]MBU1232036.1 acetyl-CoA carboxylase biotin carboxyl carrier protein [Pseudomonadota bacterium]MBU1417288.1 acetyl-CoA carboxylase biotin carboxyl carrier protein [Pseudomonadota bacterium]MBU1453969.1 acetyl-CoA carboxylase biotin carboxyl carrier protein [Pseudomonadota bacterium]